MKKICIVFSLVGLFVVVAAPTGNLSRTGNEVTSFAVSCAEGVATHITSTGVGNVTSLRCANLTTTVVNFGGSNVASANKGYPVCTNAASCGDSTISLSSNNAYCESDSGSVSIKCIAVKE